MPTVFSRIIAGELPGRIVWQDNACVAFLTIAPLKPGHTLVVPRAEIDHWLDLPADTAAHLMVVAQSIGKALQQGFRPARVALMIAGMEVPHVHLHVVPITSERELHFENARPADAAALDAAASTIRQALRDLGYAQVAG